MNLKTGKSFGDGEHILYVNGAYRGDTDMGKLMHDFSCASADEMKIPLMAEKTRYLKENREGVGQMCKVMEELKEEGREEGRMQERRELAQRMLKDGIYPLEKIAEIFGLSPDEVKKLQTRPA